MNRAQLIAAVAHKADMTHKQAERVLDALGNVMAEAVHDGQKVSLVGVLSVERVERAPRVGRHPRTGEPIQLPARYSVRLSCGSRLKAAARGYLRTVL